MPARQMQQLEKNIILAFNAISENEPLDLLSWWSQNFGESSETDRQAEIVREWLEGENLINVSTNSGITVLAPAGQKIKEGLGIEEYLKDGARDKKREEKHKRRVQKRSSIGLWKDRFSLWGTIISIIFSILALLKSYGIV